MEYLKAMMIVAGGLLAIALAVFYIMLFGALLKKNPWLKERNEYLNRKKAQQHGK